MMTTRGRTRTERIAAVSLVVMWLFASMAWSDTGLGRHKKLYAVPAPGKCAVDGRLDDWDLSGQVLMYVVSETADMQSAKFAIQYDADALCLGAAVRDPSPMMNRHDPKVDGDKGWDADACQFRITLDPAMGYPIEIGHGNGDMANPNVIHLTLWYYTDTQAPCLQMHSSMQFKPPRPEWGAFGVVPANLFEAKYVKMEDGRGYTFEYRIPWKTLGAKAPLKGGDLSAGTVQFNWSQPDGLKTTGGSAWCYDVMAGPGFPYQQTGCWGKIIFSEKGKLPKELVEEGVPPERPLPLKFAYDLPADSQITIQIFDKTNMSRRILVAQGDRRAGQNVELWDGLDDQGKPLPAGEYVWKGIMHDPIKQKFLFSPHASGQPPYGTDDNTGGWGGDHGVPTTPCVFGDGVLLAWNCAEAGWGILKCDLSGRRLWGSRHGATYLATDGQRFFTAGDSGFDRAEGVKLFDLADGRPLNFGNGTPRVAAPPGGDNKTNPITGLAWADATLFVSYQARNTVGMFDSASGDLKSVLSVPEPGRLAARADKSIAVISGANVLIIKDAKVAGMIADHLDQPRGVAAAPDGALYVSNAGKLQNVSVFDRDGKYLRSIGKAGGRPRIGAYDAGGMLEPGGLALDARGQLWVSETLDYPKRVSLWEAESGRLVSEFFGGCDYFGYSWIDPKKPDEIYCHNVLWKIDWQRNTCRPVSTTWRQTSPNTMIPPGPSGYNAHPRYFTAANGRQFCFGDGSFVSILSMRDGDLYKPICAFITLARRNQFFPGVQFELMKDEAKYPDGGYFWQDKNNDQTLQDGELVSTKVLNDKAKNQWISFGIRWADAKLNLWLVQGYRLKPARFEGERPVYDLEGFEPTVLAGKPQAGQEIWLDPDDGGVYSLVTGQSPSLAKWSADGTMLWGYAGLKSWPESLGMPMSAPGRLWGLTNPLGVAGNFTGNSCYFGTYHIFTRDGVYACMLMRDSRDGKGLGADVTASETLTGQLVKLDNLPGSGGKSRYFLLAGASDARVTEIFGLDTVKPLPGGPFTLSEAHAKQASDALAEYNAKLAKSKRLSIARGRKALETADPVSKAIDNTRSFTARAACDDQNLFVSFDVTSPYELVNAVADTRTVFKGGNCLDIQIAADPGADPKRKTPAPGDVRLLVTRQAGKPLAVLYRAKVKDFKGEPIVLSSPTGKESFDAIEVVDMAALDYRKTPAGFAAVVSIPLNLIGLAPKPGMMLSMDLGVLYGNATGTQGSARSYWVNNSFSANVTNDVPNESRLEPGEWGTAVIE